MAEKTTQYFRRLFGLETNMRKFVLGLGATAALAFPVHAASVNIIDGDTLSIDGTKICIVEIDTPETYKSRCENELVLGLKAKERLRALVDQGPVHYEATSIDRYGRTLARVYIDLDSGPVNVGETLMTEGFALPYRPGAEDKLRRLQVWCGQDARLAY
jgi:endonuclease YncB( thermonuclease family)